MIINETVFRSLEIKLVLEEEEEDKEEEGVILA
jgi:hypothetical protein